MKYYPLLLDLRGKKCVVVGGGQVAQRKVRTLLKAKASVWVIAPRLSKGLRELKRKKEIFYKKTDYQRKYLKDSSIVIAATPDRNINSRVAQDAKELGLLTNVVDSPDESNFIVPSVINRGGLIISISTSGKAPALAKRMRKDLTNLLVPQYAKFLRILEKLREDLKQKCQTQKLRARIMDELVRF